MEIKDKSAVDDFVADIKGDIKDDPFKADNEDPFKDTKNEIRTDQVVKEDEKAVPFHKDPKIQKFIQKEIEKVTKGLTKSETKEFVKETAGADTDEILASLQEIVGNDTPQKIAAVKRLRNALGSLEDKGAEKAISVWQKEREAEIEAEREAESELENGFENIEESFEVDITSNTPIARKTRSEFIDFIKRVAPKDSEGNITEYPDFTETFKLYQETSKKPITQATRSKEIASRSSVRSGDASNAAQPRDTSWRGVEKMLENLAK